MEEGKKETEGAKKNACAKLKNSSKRPISLISKKGEIEFTFARCNCYRFKLRFNIGSAPKRQILLLPAKDSLTS
jgi:hypothetical protein